MSNMKFEWGKELSRAALLVFLWTMIAAAVNVVSPAQIAWVGTWPATFGNDTAAVPPSYEEGDPELLRLDQALAKFQSTEIVFIDAREPEDFALGHIPGAVNFPFDWYDEYADSVLPDLDKGREIVTYCGGADCELSLYMGRQLRTEGYEKVTIFFGGYEAWQEAGLPVEETAP